ncbi:MAG: family 20 glycosylhydrolase [Rikenellaceae bacterium]
MKLKLSLGLLAISASLVSCGGSGSVESKISIIPQPQSIVVLGSNAVSVSDTTGKISMSVDTSFCNAEGYRLRVEDGTINITAGSTRGYGLALNTLEQLVQSNGTIPEVEISDSPRFEWRGFMLDVSRHFQSKEYLKEVLDILAYHKLNKFHLHLTDGIGWRMEIDAYPELTRRGAWRKIKNESVPFVNFEMSEEGSENTYGGYYTKDDLREIVAYAAERGIEVIPEIEMPGHSLAALSCYPEMRCDMNQPTEVYCAGNAQTFEFLSTILDEVMEVFPSEFIHIGGDEVGFGDWEKCPKCRKISTKGSDIQKYFVQRMERYLADNGKRMIGWDEVARDELGESAMVMSWTGWEGGIAAAEAGYDVVMAPLHYVYFDHYQAQSDYEPQAWGGDNSLYRVWTFPVIPEEMPAELRDRVKGGQANLWTENIETSEHVEYMMLPRLAALSEALWCENRASWEEFVERIMVQFDRYDSKGWNYSTSAFTPSSTLTDGKITLSTEIELFPIYYTLDGSEPTINSKRYDGAIELTESSTLRAASIRGDGKKLGNELTIANLAHKATGAKTIYNTAPNPQYDGEGEHPLTDNQYASKRGDNVHWLGWEQQDMDVTIELSEVEIISEVTLRFMQSKSNTSVALPNSLRIFTSLDGTDYTEVYNTEIPVSKVLDVMIESFRAEFAAVDAKYIRVVAGNIGTLPLGIPRGGGNAWVFTDEIAIH